MNVFQIIQRVNLGCRATLSVQILNDMQLTLRALWRGWGLEPGDDILKQTHDDLSAIIGECTDTEDVYE